MSKEVKPDDLTKVVMDYLTQYKEAIDEDVIDTVDEITRKAKEELKETSPRGKGSRANPYYRGWAVKLSKRKTGVYHKVVWNKTNYQLTHLLEFGHATRNGGRTRAIPHIRPVEEKYNVEFVDLLGKKIRRSSQ
ncbi:MAG: HK97 gp10 family phage protein [Acutalibacteraceae bacterium]|nr:HK97 gp10 family phage protein [Acutalibacteraceae bacterium]